ncbi:MAG: ABC transporter substrate-binding protein [Proteobacteria bacterium]|nr:ABC transporter substrate-binding protein [Pseudomonadota bacterium]
MTTLIEPRGRRSSPAAGGAIALALALTLAAPAAAADKVHFLMDWVPSGEHAMYYGGWDKGFWKEQGIDVNITRGYGSGDTVTKVSTGSVDFGIADIGVAISARARTNAPIKAIMMIYTDSPSSIFVLKSSGIKTFKDLEGHTIGGAPGSATAAHFPRVAQMTGTDASKVKWVNAEAGALMSLLLSKKIDGVPTFAIHEYYYNKAAQKIGEEIKVLRFSDVGYTIYATAVLTTEKMLAEKPDLTRRFLKATLKAFEWARDNPQEACDLHVKRHPEVAVDDCRGSLRNALAHVFNDHSKKTGVGRVDPERLKFTWDAISVALKLDPAFDYRPIADTSFLPAK